MNLLFRVCRIVALVTACLTAQDISGTIGGTIADPGGAGVPNARVIIANTDRNMVVREVITEKNGAYLALHLPIGNYAIRVEAKGFRPESRAGIVLNVSDNLRIDIPLLAGVVGESNDAVRAAGSDRAQTVLPRPVECLE